jgi:hypothetical protein
LLLRLGLPAPQHHVTCLPKQYEVLARRVPPPLLLLQLLLLLLLLLLLPNDNSLHPVEWC